MGGVLRVCFSVTLLLKVCLLDGASGHTGRHLLFSENVPKISLEDAAEAPHEFVLHGHKSNKNVVIGLAAGPAEAYDHSLFKRFVGSLRLADYCDDIVLGVRDIAEDKDPEVRDYLSAARVHADVIPLAPCTFDESRKCAAADPTIPMALYRFTWYLHTLDGYSDDSKVLLADTADLMFQADPFDTLDTSNGDDLFVVGEVETMPIKNQGSNAGWIKDCFGQDALDKIGNNFISCSGTTMGTVKGIRRYLKIMQGIIAEHPKCTFHGIDQGFHNYLFWNDMITGAKLVRQGVGPVNTIGLLSDLKVRRRLTGGRAGGLAGGRARWMDDWLAE
jgi:hypothetical protein